MFGPERIGRRKDPVIPLPSSQRTYLKQRTQDSAQPERHGGRARSSSKGRGVAERRCCGSFSVPRVWGRPAAA